MSPPARRLWRGAAFTISCIICSSMVPRWWCGRDAPSLLSGHAGAHRALADQVAGWASSPASSYGFHTGSARFDGEWAFVACMMSVLGLGQLAESDPALRASYLPSMRSCVQRMRSADGRRFGTEAWGQDGLQNLDSPQGHAYLGYFNLALGMLRSLDPGDPTLAPLHDALTSALLRRVQASSNGMIATYPGEVYPPDVCAVVGSLGLHARATATSHQASIEAWSRMLRAAFLDKATGMLVQTAHDAAGGQPRASGTAVCAYMISFADPALSRDLYTSMRKTCGVTVLGFGAIREYPPGTPGGWGDIDSGPVVLGLGLSASGFALASARMHGDSDMFTALWRSAYLFGAPVERDGKQRFLTGGALGNATLLAMTTAHLRSVR